MTQLNKHCLIVVFGLALPGIAAGQLLIDDARNIAILNEGNLTPVTYELPAPSPEAVEFNFKLKGSVFGIGLLRANYTGWVDEEAYTVYTDLKTSGLAALIKKLEIWAVTTGTYDQAGLSPRFHIQQNRDKKNRRVEMIYDDTMRGVDVSIEPRLGSQGVPPASPAERYEADDTVSAIMQLMMRGQRIDAPVCNGDLRVFDSKQHYNLRLVQDGTRQLRFEGEKVETVRCRVYYEPISGFDPEDLPDTDDDGRPITIYFLEFPAQNLNIPIRFTYKVGAFNAVIRLTDIKLR